MRTVILAHEDMLSCHVNDIHGPWTHVRVGNHVVEKEKVTITGSLVKGRVPDYAWILYDEPVEVCGDLEYGEYVLRGEKTISAPFEKVEFARVFHGPGTYKTKEMAWGWDAEKIA